jgi:hypothetical protein
MDAPGFLRDPRVLLLTSLAAFACGRPARPPLQAGLVAALAALPWETDPTGWMAFCSAAAPCDTVLVEPRVVRVPHPAPVFFVPGARPQVLNLASPPAADLTGLGRPYRFAEWGECLAKRHDRDWPDRRVACVALGLAGDSAAGDTVHLAVLALTPGTGLAWPRLRLVAIRGHWRAELVSNAGE